MGLSEGLFAPWLLWLTSALFLLGLVWAVRDALWMHLNLEQPLQHTFFGAAVALALLWQLRAGLSPGLVVHIFAITVVTMMLGWGLAVMAGLAALAFTCLTGKEPWSLFAVNGLVTVIVPALVSHGIILWERRQGFRNFFAYLFFCGYFGAALAVGVAGCVMVVLLWASGTYSFYHLVHDYLRYLPLIMLPEGLVNGMVATGIMVFHPQRLLTLEESRYLQ